MPAEFQGNRSVSSACGTIVLWSRQGEPRPRKRKKGEPSPASQIAAMVEQLTVFTAQQVDRPAQVDSSNIIRPVYPDSMYSASASGQVLAEFVVSASGEVNIDTFNVVMATHASFINPVRFALKDQRFFPAIRQGKAVQQVVQLPFRFLPDSTVPRRR